MEEKETASKEYLEKQAAAKQWIEEVINQPIGEDLAESLRDGIVLCNIISVLCPSMEISVITSTPLKYRIMENISAFLEACTTLGFSYVELFTPPDLFEKKNMTKVVDTLQKIADYASQFDFPKWKGPKSQSSRTERRSVIKGSGGGSVKSVLPKGAIPFKRPALPKSSSPLHLSSSNILDKSTNNSITSSKPEQSLEELKKGLELPTETNNITSGRNKSQPITEEAPKEEILHFRDEVSLSLPKPLTPQPPAEKSKPSNSDLTFSSRPGSTVLPQTSNPSSPPSTSFNPSNTPSPSSPSIKPAPITSHNNRLSTFQKVQQNLFLPEDIKNSPQSTVSPPSRPSPHPSHTSSPASSSASTPASPPSKHSTTSSLRSTSQQNTQEKVNSPPPKHHKSSSSTTSPTLPKAKEESVLSKRSSEHVSLKKSSDSNIKQTKERKDSNKTQSKQDGGSLRGSRDIFKDEKKDIKSNQRPSRPSALDMKFEFSSEPRYELPKMDSLEPVFVGQSSAVRELERALKKMSAHYSESQKNLELTDSKESLQRKAYPISYSLFLFIYIYLTLLTSLVLSDTRLMEYLSQLPRHQQEAKSKASQSSSSLLTHISPPSSPSFDNRPIPPPKPSRSSLATSSEFSTSSGALPLPDPLTKKKAPTSNRHSLPPLPAPPLNISSSSITSSYSPSSSVSSLPPLPPVPSSPGLSSSSTTSPSQSPLIDGSRRLQRTHRTSFVNLLSPLLESLPTPSSPPSSSSPESSPSLSGSSSSSSSSPKSSHRRNHSISNPPALLDSTHSSSSSPAPSPPSPTPSHSLPHRGSSPKNVRKGLSSDTFSPGTIRAPSPLSSSSRPTPLPPSPKSTSSHLSPLTKTAVVSKPKESIEVVLQKLDEMAASSADGSTVLHLGARHNHPHVISFLLQCGEDPNPQDTFGKTPLHVAAAHGNREIVDILLSAEINTIDSHGATALQRAAEHNQASIMSKIAAVPGVKLNTLRHQDGWTPLYTASHQGNHDIVSILLSYHADPNVRNSDGWTPLHAASHQGHYRVVKILATAGANLNVLSNQGTTPLFHAVDRGDLKIAKLLGKLGANLDLSKNFGWKPIHMAVYKSNFDLTLWLVTNGSKLNEIVRDTNLKGYTPLHILVSSDWLSEASKKNLELLLKAGASMLTRDDSGATPLHLATYWDNVDAVKTFLKFVKEDDIIFDIKDNNGETAADIAAWYGNLQVLKLLPRNNNQKVKYNPQTTGKMLPPQAPPLPPPQLPTPTSPLDG